MIMVKEIFERVIEEMERNDRACFGVAQTHGGFLEQRQHGAFALGKMFSGRAVLADGGQRARQQMKLIGDERIRFRKVVRVGVKFLFYVIVKDYQIFNNGGLLAVEQTQRLRGGVGFLQNALSDDRVHVRGGQRQARVETPLNFREVVPLDFRNGVDVLLTGNNHPRFSLAFPSQFFRDGLQI